MELIKINALLRVLVIAFIIVYVNTVRADLIGPTMVIEEKWGETEENIGFQSEDTGNVFADLIKINKTGHLFIADKINKRVKIYQANGKYLSAIRPQNIKINFYWPAYLGCDSNNNIYTSNFDSKLQKYNSKGELLWTKDVMVGAINMQYDDGIIIGGKTSVHYLPDGNVFKIYSDYPLELGAVKERSVGNRKYESTVEFPDYTYKVNAAIGNYSRDVFANFYDILYEARNIKGEVEPVICYTVIRVDRCTREEYVFEPPRSEYAGYSPEEINAPAPRREIKIEYGEPIISPLGDLYCWARTKTEYKILKWTWQGPEDAPQSLQISIGLAGLKLNWQKPIKDADTVTGYQILRSTEVCGSFTEVKTVKKDKLAFEDATIKPPWKYYYVVKAVRDKKLSGESNKVYMQWK